MKAQCTWLSTQPLAAAVTILAMLLLGSLSANADELKEGYYRIISAGNGSGYTGGPYNYEGKVAWYNDQGLVRWATYDANDYAMIYQLKRVDGDWTIYNLRDQTYVDQGTALYGAQVQTSKTAKAQTLTLEGTNKYIIQASGANYIYSMVASHNGSDAEYGDLSVWGTPQEAAKYGVNLWYLSPVSDEVVSYLKDGQADPTVTIGTTPEAPVAGGKYVIKNATADFYITSSGGMTTSPKAERDYFWQIEASGKSVDGYPTYYLKSVDKNAYWKQVDYASKTWDDGNPYDAYDWYNYAGLNAEFGDAASAMEVTILKAGSTSDWRSANATDGYVLAMRNTISTASKTFYYKLGHQDNNVGMEPWNEGVGWLFYPVNDSSDAYDELQSIIATYGNMSTSETASDDPGFYSRTAAEAYKAALQEAKAIKASDPRNRIRQAAAALQAAAEALQDVNPITEGYYYIVTAGNGPGYYTGDTAPDVNYNYEGKAAMYNNNDIVSWKTFDPNDFNFIYHFFPDGQGNWYVQSALNATFIGKGNSTYSTKVNTSGKAETPQEFALVSEGKYTIKFSGNPYVYSMAAGHKGSDDEEGDLNIWGSTAEATKFGVNVWYLKRVSDEVMDAFSHTDAGLMAVCTEYETVAKGLVTTEAPGYYYADNIEALNSVIATVRQKAATELTDNEKAALRKQLDDAYAKAMEVRPITDGYYYLVNNYETYYKTFGNYPAIYTTSLATGGNNTACYYDKYETGNANYLYKISKATGDNAYTVQNAYTLRYLNTGEGSGKAGEVLTSSPEAVNSQLIRWHSAGKYWIADEVGNAIGHAIANPSALNRRLFVVGATAFDETVGSSLSGYNTWSLLPVTTSEAIAAINAQRTKDEGIAKAYGSMVAYSDEIAADYNDMTTDISGKYNVSAVTILKSRHSDVEDYITARPYDITTTAAEYTAAEAALRSAYNKVLTAKPDTASYQLLGGTPIGATSVDYTTNQPSTTANTPANAFDGDYTTDYAAYERSTGWVGLDLGQPYIIERVAYAPRAGWASRMVLGIFEGANKPDFSDAIPIHMIRTAPEYEKLTTEDVFVSRGFRYVRYVGPNEARCNVSELRFYGRPGIGDDSQFYQITNLPTVVIRTLANVADVTSKSTWLPGRAYVISDEGTAVKGDSMNVRGRGNGSWTFVKKPYKLKFANKTKLLNMPAKAKKWTLINNYGDKTLIRNNVAFALSRIFEMDYTPACTLVDVIFNGQYKGSYQLCDQIEVRKNRVDITEMTPEDNEGETLTGGYLIELDAYAGSEPKHFSSSPYGIPVTVHYPEDDVITDQQFSYIRTAFNELCSRVYSADYKDENEGYAKVLAEDTWLKYFLIEELSGNTDGYWSVYMTKDRNDKFRVSPVWDFDLAFDNDRRTHPILTMTDFLSLSSRSSAASGVRNFNRKIVESCTQELKELWSWYRYNGNLTNDRLHEIVDSLGVENDQSQQLNYTRWDILNTATQQQYTVRGSYKAEVDFVFEYLADRLAWMDNKVGLEEPIGIHSATPTEAKGGIHGHDGHILVRGFRDGSAVRVYTAGGQLVSTTTIQDFDNRIDLPKGIYIVRVTEPDGTAATRKVAVQ